MNIHPSSTDVCHEDLIHWSTAHRVQVDLAQFTALLLSSSPWHYALRGQGNVSPLSCMRARHKSKKTEGGMSRGQNEGEDCV